MALFVCFVSGPEEAVEFLSHPMAILVSVTLVLVATLPASAVAGGYEWFVTQTGATRRDPSWLSQPFYVSVGGHMGRTYQRGGVGGPVAGTRTFVAWALWMKPGSCELGAPWIERVESMAHHELHIQQWNGSTQVTAVKSFEAVRVELGENGGTIFRRVHPGAWIWTVHASRALVDAQLEMEFGTSRPIAPRAHRDPDDVRRTSLG
jgi:hypothetical protein